MPPRVGKLDQAKVKLCISTSSLSSERWSKRRKRGREREIESVRDTHTERQREVERERVRDRERERVRERERERGREREIERD